MQHPRILRSFFAAVPLLLLTGPASARWNHRDASSLNRVTGLGVEYSNDILSYRDVFFDAQAWEQSLAGFRSSAGSLNKKEFLFAQHVQIRSSTQDAWRLGFVADREEDPRHIRDNAALELSYGPPGNGWRLGVLGDGHTEKSFADLGMKLNLKASEDSGWQIIGWSVDTFYTEKKLQREDYRTSNPWTWEISGFQRWGPTTLRLGHEQDEPVVWYQASKDQRYAYRRKATELQGSYDWDAARTFYLTLDQAQEHESLGVMSRAESQGYQDTRRIVEIGQRIEQGRESFNAALWGLWASTRKQNTEADASIDQLMTRQELAWLANWSRPFWDDRQTQHWGLALNQVRLHEDKRERATEVKISWGPEFALGSKGKMRLISTWDIDQLVADFPFDRQGFHPWGGGHASFFIVF